MRKAMPQDKELEIRLQFLEEATEYLNAIESAILELVTAPSDSQIDAVLRAAHSIKGGAAMMGFQTMSHLAHRFEDFFKVLKIQKPAIDNELESLLLAAVDCLRQIVDQNRQGIVVDERWLERDVNPVFEQLDQRLGEPQAEEATASLLPEEGQDMVVLIFETEVEGCLQRLESTLAGSKNAGLFEELSIMAQDLAGLGEMLELNAFRSLCESVTHHLEATPERVEEIAHLALQEWRRSQAVLLVGQADTLPTQIILEEGTPVPANPIARQEERLEDLLVADSDRRRQENKETPLSPSPPNVKEYQENTVRVPIKLLDQINDLFGELTIARNGINLYLKRLRNLVRDLSHRVRRLQRFNTGLRKADDITTPAAVPSLKETGDSGLKNWHARDSDRRLLPEDVGENIVRIQEVTDDIDLSIEDTDQTVSELNRTAKQLQTSLTQVRMRPLSELVGRFPRFLRDLSLQYGKNVELKIHGDGILIDRTILEALSDPLMHLLRNAFDHGIEDPATRQARGKPEQGVIEIRAITRGNQTLIAVSDDGGGIELDTIRRQADRQGFDATASDEKLLSLIFEPGFSTAGQVTALSGRGVGLDVVRTNLRKVRGDIKVDTQPGVGTTFTLSVPLTLSIARVLIVESNKMLLAFPSDAVEEMLLLNPEPILIKANSEFLSREGRVTPLVRLSRWLEFRCPQKSPDSFTKPIMDAPSVLMVKSGNEWVAIQVDRCWGEQEVTIRQVEGAIAMPPGFSGCTILGDGRVVPLVNAPELLHWIANSSAQENKPPTAARTLSQKDTILVVDDSINVRRFLSLTLEKAGYRVEQAKDGQDALEKILSGLQVRAVICDIDMPRLDGYGLLARIKSNPAFKQLPIAMLSSRSGQKDRQLAMNLGAMAYFCKPYNEQELLQTLKQLLQN
jgi:chemosensory pili system protein ChpA (sensor histidine kinase/response regulator)